MRNNVNAPDAKRTIVKPDASIASAPRAIRHSTELAANAMSARAVQVKVFRTPCDMGSNGVGIG